eukprot:2925828-Rhodomonas_salina.4
MLWRRKSRACGRRSTRCWRARGKGWRWQWRACREEQSMRRGRQPGCKSGGACGGDGEVLGDREGAAGSEGENFQAGSGDDTKA